MVNHFNSRTNRRPIFDHESFFFAKKSVSRRNARLDGARLSQATFGRAVFTDASLRRTDHVTVLGPYIISTRLSKALTGRIDTLYASGQSATLLTPDIIRECVRPGKLRLILEHNAVKAEKLRRILARNFYFRQPD
jgi:hypothetical protein